MIATKAEIELIIPVIKEYLLNLQHRICQFLEESDGKNLFIADHWQHVKGGGGISKILADGAIIEKAGVNFSHVQGQALPNTATTKRPELVDSNFQAMGLSLVVHPVNPYIPTTHANLRFITVDKKDDTIHWWFGGGFDLTPYYGFIEDCEHWHRTAKSACDPFGSEIYPKLKKWCDEYFYLKHRNEPRGIGGLFFDDLNAWELKRCFEFIQSIGNHFIKAYQPIMERRKLHSFGERERKFQCYRRGRYVEFNLLYDRGTLFGLQSNGRTESILMSLPPTVNWIYNWHPEKNSAEDQLYQSFLVPREWV